MAKKQGRAAPVVDDVDVREAADFALKAMAHPKNVSDEKLAELVTEFVRIKEYEKTTPAWNREFLRKLKNHIEWRRYREKNR